MVPMEALRFRDHLVPRPKPGLLAVETTLRHFAIVSYAVDPAALQAHLHPRFRPTIIEDATGRSRSLVSVVPFLDEGFHFRVFPWHRSNFGQTNYRAYVTDSETGEQVAWFFGTSLDSLAVIVPRHLWKLPWHRGRIRFDCALDAEGERYASYRMMTRSRWAPAELILDDSGLLPQEIAGFPDLETGLVVLTHPMRGYFFRRDGSLGTYAVWHDRLQLTEGRVVRAKFPLLERLGLIGAGTEPHSVLLQESTDFTIYLPPRVVGT